MGADVWNAVALVLGLVLAAAGALWSADTPRAPVEVPTAPSLPHEGATELTDARGVVVAVGDYQRIVSLNTISDHVLLRLIEPHRLVATTAISRSHPEGYRFGDRAQIASSGDVEAILALEPDLVLTSSFASEDKMSRLREQGVAVFDLGELRGVASTLDNIAVLGALLRVPDRAAVIARAYRRELLGLDLAVPESALLPGIYLTVFGDSFYGGTRGTSYATMLRLGGVYDLAADAGHVDWPAYTPEQLLTLDPPLIVTQAGMGAAICGHAALASVRACRPGGRVVEVQGQYHSDPGLGLVEAAWSVLEAVHPERAAAWRLADPLAPPE